MTHQEYKLSYPVDTVIWNGKKIIRKDDDLIDRNLDILQECGIDEVMLAGYTDVESADFDMSNETERIGEKLRSRGMRAAQHHGLAASFAPLEESQEETIKKLIASVRYTANLNADVLVLHSGRIDRHFNTVKEYLQVYSDQVEHHGIAEVLKRNADNLHQAGEEAKRLGVRIAMENLDRFEPFADMELLPQLIKLADSDAVGYCLDSGHAHCCDVSVSEWIKIMGDKLFTTHFHDNRGSQGRNVTPGEFIPSSGIDEHLPPGFGTIPWIDVIKTLRKINYKNTVNFESGPWPDMPEKEGYQTAIKFWRTCEYLTTQKGD
ncbi:MAG: sugar phosphate isomerase/epimerase [Victivallales bacterium]|nr:sugar phosphate isomerase/epimerase [Victivallales bacterium]